MCSFDSYWKTTGYIPLIHQFFGKVGVWQCYNQPRLTAEMISPGQTSRSSDHRVHPNENQINLLHKATVLISLRCPSVKQVMKTHADRSNAAWLELRCNCSSETRISKPNIFRFLAVKWLFSLKGTSFILISEIFAFVIMLRVFVNKKKYVQQCWFSVRPAPPRRLRKCKSVPVSKAREELWVMSVKEPSKHIQCLGQHDSQEELTLTA